MGGEAPGCGRRGGFSHLRSAEVLGSNQNFRRVKGVGVLPDGPVASDEGAVMLPIRGPAGRELGISTLLVPPIGKSESKGGGMFLRGQPPRGRRKVRGPGGVNGDFSAQLTFGWKENEHPGRRRRLARLLKFHESLSLVSLVATGASCKRSTDHLRLRSLGNPPLPTCSPPVQRLPWEIG